MILHACTWCLSGAETPVLEDLARALLRAHPAVREVHIDRVRRHIPTDSLSDRRDAVEVTPLADQITALIEVYLDPAVMDAVRASAPWQAALARLHRECSVLFGLEGEANVPIALQQGAQDGGLRRVMLLRRNEAHTVQSFREAWFGRHASLVQHQPHIRGYLQNMATQRTGAQGQSLPYEQLAADGLAHICYADEAAMEASYASPERDAVKADGRGMLSRINTFLLDTKVLRRA